MLRKAVKTSLTARIFLLTFLMLFAASAVTYGVIVLATPITTTAVSTDHFRAQVYTLPELLSHTTLEDSGRVIDWFIRDTGGSITITGKNGLPVDIPSDLGAGYEDPVLTDWYVSTKYGSENVSNTVNGVIFSFSFRDSRQLYRAYVYPPTERSDQTLQVLGRVAPWLLAIMLLFSALCARLFSRSITRPIVALSGTAQRMAELDFTRQCGESRADEIGALGHSLNQLSRNLSAALNELRQANAALKLDMDRERELERQRLAFFSAASHELKTPITILEGQLTGMLDRVDVYQDRDKYLAKALQVTGRMEKLVQEILTVSRMERSGFEPVRQPADLTQLVREQIALYDELICQKGLQAVLDLPDSAPVTADPALLRKVLDNVLSNAVFYAPDGAELSIIATGGSETVLIVENSGSHIPEEALPHVFEAFYRAESSRNRRTGGSGLGLYIVKMILDRHGAHYALENTENGVRFTLRFS